MAMTNQFGIDFSVLERMKEGLDRMLVKEPFLEGYRKRFKASDDPRAVYEEAKRGLVLFEDLRALARDTRLTIPEYLKEHPEVERVDIDTQDEFLAACAGCPDSNPDAVASVYEEARRVLLQCREAIEVQVPAMVEEHKAAMEDLREDYERRLAENDARHERQMKELRESFERIIADMQGRPAPQAAPADKQRLEEEAEKVEKKMEKRKQEKSQLLGMAGFAEIKAILTKASDSDLKDYLEGVRAAGSTDEIVFVKTKHLLEFDAATADQVDSAKLAHVLGSISTCPGNGYDSFRSRLKRLANDWRKEHPSK